MSKLNVYHNHVLIGQHDPQCLPLFPGQTPTKPYYRYHDGNDLVIMENGNKTTYKSGEWSAADIDLVCGYMTTVGPVGCPRCDTAIIHRDKKSIWPTQRKGKGHGPRANA